MYLFESKQVNFQIQEREFMEVFQMCLIFESYVGLSSLLKSK